MNQIESTIEHIDLGICISSDETIPLIFKIFFHLTFIFSVVVQ